MDIPEELRRQVVRNRGFPDFAEALPAPQNAHLQLLAPQRIVAIGIHSTISKDNTAGEKARRAGLLAHLGKNHRDCTESANLWPIKQLGISPMDTEGHGFGDDFGDDFEREIHPPHHMSYEEQFKRNPFAPLETQPTSIKTASVPSRGILRPPRDSPASSSSALFEERPSIQVSTPNGRQPAATQQTSDNEIARSRDASPDEYHRSFDSYWAYPAPDDIPRDGFHPYRILPYTTPLRTPSPGGPHPNFRLLDNSRVAMVDDDYRLGNLGPNSSRRRAGQAELLYLDEVDGIRREELRRRRVSQARFIIEEEGALISGHEFMQRDQAGQYYMWLRESPPLNPFAPGRMMRRESPTLNPFAPRRRDYYE